MLWNKAKRTVFIAIIGMSALSAGQAIGGGYVHFTGALVEGPCKVTMKEGKLISSCLQESHQVSRARQVTYQNDSFMLPADAGQVDIEWFGPHNNWGKVTVDYR
ncbi:hypothetical protein [Enterobacillus tribolii]|uniref:Type 1 fimbria pilin n=1 Tax=Enterobacillus tribolii TaxID=1487935 RepID=A0A370R3R2_9GAMM|nr:hypothetical protein [Enterobacillus tribolii]MBW7984335.1 hypothetical protein [Enterobacillus tribolii]RDK97072.1 hypothetical protein C8D90_101516 [Enterobacillus tribolii]